MLDGENWLTKLSYHLAPVSGITPCFKIDKPLMVYIFRNVVTGSITTLRS